MTNIDLLQEAVNAGIINLDSVQEQIDMKKKEKILKEHSYSIWEGKDGKWRTYVFDETKAKNRRLIKRKTKEDIEDFIVKEYDRNHKGVNETTIKTLYPEWLQYKYLKVNSPNTIKRIQNDWERFYDNDHYNQEHDTDIINIPIQELSKLKLDKWAHHMVKFGNTVPSKSIRHKRKDMRSNMTKKQYYGVSLIAREILDYAVDNGIIDKNYFDQIKIDKRLYRKVLKKKSENEVFLVNEVNDIIHLAWKDFEEHPSNLAILAIILNFYMGTRVGELVVLKTSEGVADSIVYLLKKYIKASPISLFGALFLKGVFRKLKKQIDYAEYGGAPLLGIDGNVIICHGKSNAKAMKNAIFQAIATIENSINDKILESLEKYKD